MSEWTINKRDAQTYMIKDRHGLAKGLITMKGDGRWKVELLMVNDLTYNSDIQTCIGYVRGVEAALKLNYDIKEAV